MTTLSGRSGGRNPGSIRRPSALTPRDAGSVIVVAMNGETPRLLMGRRAVSHVFMPGRAVFPGGRVERCDLAAAQNFSLRDEALARLSALTARRFDDRRAIAVALAAIRETWEETGVMIARPGAFEDAPGPWRAFADKGLRPDPTSLIPLARAITPPGHPRRYDARFFVTSDASIAHREPAPPTDEFDHVEWHTLDSLEDLPLADITRQIIKDLHQRIVDGSWHRVPPTIPFYRHLRGRPVRDLA